MTPRSPKQQPKTSTISQRLRIRTDQNLSTQPPELHQLRDIRSRRAQTLSSNRHIKVNYQSPESQPVWDPSQLLDQYPRSNTSHPVGSEQNHQSSLLLSQPLRYTPYHSPQPSPSNLVPISTRPEENYKVQHTSGSHLLPSPLPSHSGHHNAAEYELRLSTEPEHLQHPSVELQDMSTLGFMMSAPYASLDHHYGSSQSDYPPMSHQQYAESKAPSSGPYAPSYASSPSLHGQNQQRRSGEHPILPPYQPQSVPRSPYQQTLGPMRASPTPISYPPTSNESTPMSSSTSHSYSYPAVHANLPGQNLNTSSYTPPPIYPPTSYEISGYNPLPTSMYPTSTSTSPYPSYEPSPGLAPPTAGNVPGLSSSPSGQGNGVMPRVLNSRPKPQCWEHGCNGRQFSTFSNLLRHQREKSGTAAKSYCPRCGAEFTRTTARNGHMAHEKCKQQRRASDSSR
ncbi:hypothetical protein K504DRAFT_504613 [Pleomassaria siparia CBS 279.74]|uniref:C2H2-type domain-containing protein n=1 Tax=Pleomassaria siparia CBS 279.74 TaxID=1314801 RepID=A0A6G1K3J9_9PLEO|nr:hypothetical protein K504DRAFT_504613 [Pleomassaria siparia CBS 279.74]